MKNLNHKNLFTVLFIIGAISCFAQPNSVGIIIKNQPDNPIVLGIVKGDNFIAIDSTLAENELVRFNLPNDALIGVYRLILGQTKYAKVMGESPQQLDFIFNKEDIVLETDFDAPETKTREIQSVENKVWFRFKERELVLKQQLNELEKSVNYYWSNNDSDNVIEKANEYNQLQIERDLFISQMIKENEGLFAAKLIQTFREPMLDGYLTEIQRKELFKKEYLKLLDFSDETLIYSQGYTDNIFNYLVSYNQKNFTQKQRELEYIKAVDLILEKINKNEKVQPFIIDYLIHGFEVLQLQKVITHISETLNK